MHKTLLNCPIISRPERQQKHALFTLRVHSCFLQPLIKEKSLPNKIDKTNNISGRSHEIHLALSSGNGAGK